MPQSGCHRVWGQNNRGPAVVPIRLFAICFLGDPEFSSVFRALVAGSSVCGLAVSFHCLTVCLAWFRPMSSQTMSLAQCRPTLARFRLRCPPKNFAAHIPFGSTKFFRTLQKPSANGTIDKTSV
jgi:hypothetical protein